MSKRIWSLFAAGLAVTAGTLFSQSPSPVSPFNGPPAVPSAAPTVAASAAPSAAPSLAASPSAVPSLAAAPSPAPSPAEKAGHELTILYTSNVIGEVDPCG